MKTEFDILNDYEAGILKGIYITDEAIYIPVRITGLGISHRLDEEATIEAVKQALNDTGTYDIDGIKELAKCKGLSLHNYAKYKALDRSKEIFADDGIIKSYQGLPILLDHPENNNILDLTNFKNNVIIGTIVRSYLKDDKTIWGIAKIFDKEVLSKLDKYKSTSPAITSFDVIVGDKLVEVPNSFNHLAFVENGFWDFQGSRSMDLSKVTKEDYKVDTVVEQVANSVEEPKIEEVDEEIEEVDEEEGGVWDKLDKEHKKLEEDNVEEEVKTDNEVEEVVTEIDEDEVEEITDSEDVDVATGIADEEEDEIVDEKEEIDEDKERKEVLDKARSLCDSVSNILEVKMPYIDKRLTSAETIKKFLTVNSQYVDSKYDGLLFDDTASKGVRGIMNRQLLKEIFIDTCKRIDSKANETMKQMNQKQPGWLRSNKPNVMIDPEF